MIKRETIDITILQLCQLADLNNDSHDINSAIGEVEIKGKTYQIQMSLVLDKSIWVEENEVRYSEVVKVH